MFGAFLAIALIGWERISAIMFALFYRGEIDNVTNFLSGILARTEPVLPGGLGHRRRGAGDRVFALSAISIPMVMDRDTDTVTAAMTSLRAVQVNFDAMLLWAVMIVVLIGIGYASMMIGMVILLPLVGHATWHAYRDLVR